MTLDDITPRDHGGDLERAVAEAANVHPVTVIPATRTLLAPKPLAFAGSRGGVSVVRVVPREHLLSRRVYVALDGDGEAVYVGSTSDEIKRWHEHEARLHRRMVLDVHRLELVWFPAADGYAAERGLIKLLRPPACATPMGRGGKPAPLAGREVAALAEAGIWLPEGLR